MDNKKDNQRVKITKKIIKNTLVDMLEDMDINKITVSSLCKRAEINRSTFYNYYDNIYDLLKKIEDEIFNEIKEDVKKHELDGCESFTDTKHILEKIKENKKLYLILAKNYNDKEFFKKVKDIGKSICINRWKRMNPEIDEKYLEVLYIVYSNGHFNLMLEWLNGNLEISEKDIIELENKMFNIFPSVYDKDITK